MALLTFLAIAILMATPIIIHIHGAPPPAEIPKPNALFPLHRPLLHMGTTQHLPHQSPLHPAQETPHYPPRPTHALLRHHQRNTRHIRPRLAVRESRAIPSDPPAWRAYAYTQRHRPRGPRAQAPHAQQCLRGAEFGGLGGEDCGEGNGGSGFNVDWRLWSNLFTIDAIVEIALSEKTHMLEAGNDSIAVPRDGRSARALGFVWSMHGGARIASWFVGAPAWFPILKGATRLLFPWLRRQWEQGEDFGAIVRHLVARRLSRVDEPDDFLACLVSDKNGEPRSLERGEIEAEANMLRMSSINPETLIKLRAEVADALSSREPIAAYARVKNLPYLKACLEESLRLSPPLPRGLERKTPAGGMMIAGEWIGGNIGVSVPAYAAHRDSIIFPDAEQFIPERWLRCSSDELAAMRAAFIPFSTGARGCIGRHLTMMEQQILVATLVHAYDFALPGGFELEYEEAFNLWPGPMPMRIWRRR
ncbi:uncharacterized protein DSM5745_00350 [Aspergillus mulundensis]|uniref:Cytochrome P450 n=1 Tax=Aspergillus mulundensis TaxID=1810919 RepID=A0A3D8T4V6_9EURO|nr:hypothetical protein DSM5745_00350 [Aspergillus mulundensis]RDW93028.1 hypothetical protein DSM5745_00350 [Aspergillus mulundensis]